MPARLKQLRMHFGLDQHCMAHLIGCELPDLERWETKPESMKVKDQMAVADRLGICPGWLGGADVAMWNPHVLAISRWLSQEMLGLSGLGLVEMLSATTGERIAYAVNLMRRADREVFTLEGVAGWLGLSVGSTRLLLRGELDPGTPVVMRASELTGMPERWFRAGPEEAMREKTEAGGPAPGAPGGCRRVWAGNPPGVPPVLRNY